jgi:hypothetical protein
MIRYHRSDTQREATVTLDKAIKQRMGDKTQVEFAAELGIAQSTLSGILAGEPVPGLNKTADAIVRRYPELLPLFLQTFSAVVLDYLCSAKGTGEVDDATAE